MDDLKLCKDCKHFVNLRYEVARCAYPGFLKNNPQYLVTGSQLTLISCINARRDHFTCGQNGTRFEAAMEEKTS